MIRCLFCNFSAPDAEALRRHSACCADHPLYSEAMKAREQLGTLLAQSQRREETLRDIQRQLLAFADRIAAQSDLLSKKAEKEF